MEVWHLSYALSQVPCSLVILESPHQQFIAPTPPNHSRVLQSKSLTCWIINPISYQHGPSPDWKFSDQKHANNDHFYPHKREYNLNKIVVGWRTRLPLCTKIFYQAEPPSGRTEYGFLFSSVAQSCLTPWRHGLQHARRPCPSPTPGVYLNSRPLSWWCHPTISSSVVPFSSRLQSFPTSGSLPGSQFFASGGHSIGVLKFSFNFSPLVAQMVKNPPSMWETWVWSLSREDPLKEGIATHWRRQWHPTPVLLPGKSHGQRSLVGCSPQGH